jgi:poly(beta-D-mannuronate) lyase
VRDISSNKFYNDARHSVVDPTLWERRKTSIKPLKDFEAQIAVYASRAQNGSEPWGVCTGRWLAAWAGDDALLGQMSEKQAQLERNWALAALAMAYVRAKEYIAKHDRALIEPWLARIGNVTEASLGKLRNNHYYWLGFALAATGHATGAEHLNRRAGAIFDEALLQIEADGHLPLEAARGSKSLHYHNFSVLPLVMLAEIAAQRGEDWYSKNNGALHRLIRFTLDNHRDPSVLARLAEAVPEHLAQHALGWLPLYARRFPARVATEGDLVARRYWVTRAGGDMNLLAKSWVSASAGQR